MLYEEPDGGHPCRHWRCRAAEVAALLDHGLLCAQHIAELLREPAAYIDLVQAGMSERIARDLFALGFEFLDDVIDAGYEHRKRENPYAL